ncbi:hypothetical protein QLX08_002194 [Tetragonisca angustula]|uniref:Uncharacterized protein n=1 Tax=Tetragonisca angustula TaxID=166442 RepID=A0AAW1ACR8_9HYME
MSRDDEPVWSRKPTIPHGGYMFPLTRRRIKCYNCVLLLFCKEHNDLAEQPHRVLKIRVLVHPGFAEISLRHN